MQVQGDLVGVVDEDADFHLKWTWSAAFGAGEREEIWKPVADTTASGVRQYAPLLKVGPNRQLYFDASPPARAWEDSGYGADRGYHGFKTLEVRVHKTFKTGATTSRVPLQTAVRFVVQDGPEAPNLDLVTRSIDQA